FVDDEALLRHAIEALRPSALLVVGHERLFSNLQRWYGSGAAGGGTSMRLVKLPKSGGVSEEH
ncbi:hypothetical protein HK405_000045, partial [Cladochytrium tenue]